MKEVITKVINQWDPLDLFPYAPKDEYNLEIDEIVNYLHHNKNLQSDLLGKQIYKLFLRTLGSDIFLCSVDECNKVAEKILYEISITR